VLAREIIVRALLITGCVFFTGCSSLNNYLGNTWLKAEIDTCKQTIKEIPRPNLSVVDCNENESSCQDMLRRLAPSVNCAVEIVACRNSAKEAIVNAYKAKIPERCHEIKKQYPGAI
jgi:hypothetical protein